MHIPDGFLDAKTWISTAAVSAGALSYSVVQANKQLQERQVPLMGVMGAFVFAAQMVNFPVAGGTSGHLIGGTLLALTLGPWTACVIMATIVGLQALFFQDGGITVLGANILNMAVIAPLAGYLAYNLLKKLIANKTVSIFIAAWLSTVLAAAAAALELAWSNTVALKIVFPAMLAWHILIGIGEGLITAGVLAYLNSIKFNTGILLHKKEAGGDNA